MADGGVKMGIPRNQALELATQTVLGSALMVQQSGMHPAELKDMVTSPGGTTIAGVHSLEQNGFRAAIQNAIETSARRSQELGSS